VLIVRGCGGASGRYRCEHTSEQLASRGIACEIRDIECPEGVLVEALFARTILLQRVPFSPLIDSLIRFAELAGSLVIFETDDLTFDLDAIEHIHHLATLEPEARERQRASFLLQAETFKRCRLALASTDPIADAVRRVGQVAFVHRNGYSSEMAKLAGEAIARATAKRNGNGHNMQWPVWLGYFSGTHTHNLDFAAIAPVLMEVLCRYPSVRLRIVGPVKIDDAFRDFGDRIERLDAVDWRRLPDLISSVDINLAPLESENCFCDAKSEVKYIEAGLVGIPTVATATPAFRYAITPSVNGFVADSIKDWPKLLTDLIENPALRHRLGAAARKHVIQNYAPESRASTLVAFLEEARADQDSKSLGLSPLPTIVNETLRESLRAMSVSICEHNRSWGSLSHVSRRAWDLLRKRLGERLASIR